MHNNLLVPRSYLNSNFWLIKFKSNVMHTLIETYDKLLNTLFERIHDKVSLRLLCMFSPLNVMLFVHANSIIVNRTENLKLLCIYQCFYYSPSKHLETKKSDKKKRNPDAQTQLDIKKRQRWKVKKKTRETKTKCKQYTTHGK